MLKHSEISAPGEIDIEDMGVTLKVLVAIVNYGTKNDQYLHQLLSEYRSMPFPVHIVVLSNIHKDLGPGVEVVVGLPAKDPCSLPFVHKEIFARRAAEFDLFIYSEDDTLVTSRNIEAFLRVSKALPEGEVPGFLRFELDSAGVEGYPEVHGHYHWEATSVRTRGEYTLASFTNLHSACYLLTRRQLQRAIESGGFLVLPHQEKYDLCCTAATDPYTQCGFEKMICVSHLDDFVVHHLSNKYVGVLGIERAELQRQIDVLMGIGRNGHRPKALLQTQTRLRNGRFSKSYYEPVREEIISAIPPETRSVLSLGCGSGATERWLANKGLRVVAVPLDPVIAGSAKNDGVEIIEGDLSTARKRLKGERFDCILFLNVLHLLKDPAAILSSYASVLSDNSVAIIVAPNLCRIQTVWRKLCRDVRFKDVGFSSRKYRDTGVTFSTCGAICNWIQDAGMRPKYISSVVPSASSFASRVSLGLMDRYLAAEFLAVAEKRTIAKPARHS